MAENKIDLPAGSYQITWEKKPLGFSIVMDTTGKNAYVSSIQAKSNEEKGLKLAAQIIYINKEDVRGVKHQEILKKIKGATLPMTLAFHPRSFAHETNDKEEEEEQEEENKNEEAEKDKEEEEEDEAQLLFGGAEGHAAKRVNGRFRKYKKKGELLMSAKRPVWIHDDEEEDAVILWWFPGDHPKNSFKRNVWMISRETKIHTDQAYACCKVPEKMKHMETPDQFNDSLKWQIFDIKTRKFKETQLTIAAQVKGDATKY